MPASTKPHSSRPPELASSVAVPAIARRALVAIALGALAAGCSSSAAFTCTACSSDQDCLGGQSCRLGYCVGTDQDPRRCPGAQEASSGSSGSSTGSSGTSSSGSSDGSSGTSSNGSSGGSSGTSSSSSSSGGTGSSGSSGSTGACQVGPPQTNPAFIDDFEDGDKYLLTLGGRNGAWFEYADNSGGTIQPPVDGFVPSAGANDGSCYAAHLTGSGFTSYAGIGLAFKTDSPGGAAVPYDASGYGGISFRARSGSANAQFTVFVSDQQSYSAGTEGWGSQLQLTATWTTYTLNWSQLTGPSTPLDTTQLMTLGIQPVDPSSFDLWVDDLQFVP